MFRLLIGMVAGWLVARWYYSPEMEAGHDMAGGQSGDLGNRARRVIRETGSVVRELSQETMAASKIERNNLEDKLQRIRDAAKS